MLELIEKLMKDGHAETAEKLKKYYHNAIYLTDKSYSDGIPVGASKMGGYPDLPPEIEYPTMSAHTQEWNYAPAENYAKSAMQIFAQINLYEVAESGTDIENLLPKKGMLYIFWSGELFNIDDDIVSDVAEPDKTECFKVIYWNGDMSTLKRTPPPCPYYSKYFEENECMEESAIDFADCDEYEEIVNIDYDLSENTAKLLGVPKGVNCPYLKDDEILLFQGDYNMGCLWSEYWIIKREDLKKCDFSKVRFDYDMD